MPIHTVISLLSVAVATAALVFSRRDSQSKKSREELADLRQKIEDNERKIRELEDRIKTLAEERDSLQNENVRLMRAIMNCPTEDCPVLPKRPGGGIERRRNPR